MNTFRSTPQYARYALHDNIAVITLDHPPVNGLGFELRTAIAGALERASADPQVKAIVLIGAGGVFSGGADLRQLDTPEYWAWPRTIELARCIDGIAKPVVAAIGTLALGGGLELALGCHYRVAMPNSQLGQPEIKLGLLPGGGGTLRLPRLIGVDNAVTMMLGGEPIDGEQARRWGLVDALIGDELLAGSMAFARDLVNANAPLRRARDLPVALDNPADYFAACRARVARPAAGPAPLMILECIEAAVMQDFDDATKVTNAGNRVIVRSPESKALVYLFFAERQAGKIEGVGDEAIRQAKPGRVVIAGQLDPSLASQLLSMGCELEEMPSDRACFPGAGDFIGLRMREASRLVEVLRASTGNDAALMAMTRMLRRAGKLPLLSACTEESMGEPLLRAFHARVRALERQGVSAACIDRALRLWGIESGPMLSGVQDGGERAPMADTDIVQVCVAAMAQEGKRMLAVGTVARASDLDVAMVTAYGFPRIRGGPMYYSDQ